MDRADPTAMPVTDDGWSLRNRTTSRNGPASTSTEEAVTAPSSFLSVHTGSRNGPALTCAVCRTVIPSDGVVYRCKRVAPNRHGEWVPGLVCQPCHSKGNHGVPYALVGQPTSPDSGPCDWCGRQVVTGYSNRRRWRTCSEGCAYELTKEAQNERRAHRVGLVHTYTCQRCEKKFTSRRSSKSYRDDLRPTYCSGACRQAAYRDRQKAKKEDDRWR